jgi:NDP-sugar pyrophosphorylase family protein
MRKTVVIPAAGLGSRLDEFTKNYNKAMCTLGPKPVISYIIEKFTKDDEIIILLGYKGDLLKQVVEACYPDWNIKFVLVDCFQGPGSGLGYSLSCAKALLQKPFMFWSNDSIIDEDIDQFDFSHNFMVLSKFRPDKADSYRHAKVGKYQVQSILPKGEYDTTGETTLPYIGISYIKDYKQFWQVQEDMFELFVNAGESAGLQNLPDKRYFVTSTWTDTGNKEELIAAKERFSKNMEATILEKPEEAIWFIDNKVVKFHIDKNFISGRVKRFHTFINDDMKEAGITMPKLISNSANVYVYEKAQGKIMSKEVTPDSFDKFIKLFFNSVHERHVSDDYKLMIYNDFYKNKTLGRIEKYCKGWEDLDGNCVINGIHCMSASKIINAIDWEVISRKAIITDNYHGDFHLENILINKTSEGDYKKTEFVMLDWRQNFGNTFDGDIYYDLAKMWHSLIVNHNMVKDNLFTFKQRANGEYEIDIHRSFIDTECEEKFKKFLENSNYDNVLAEFLTAVIFLNIAACHVGVYSSFLFYLGKYLINKFIQNHPDYLRPGAFTDEQW